MDICIRKLTHDIYVYVTFTVSPVALLGLHEIVGWWFSFKNISTVCKVLAPVLPLPPSLFSGCQGVIDFD